MPPQRVLWLVNAAIAMIAALVMLAFQVHTYRTTRHRSSLILLWGSIIGIYWYVLMYLPWFAPRPFYSTLTFQLWLSGIFIIQIGLTVWGSQELFSAFRRLFGPAPVRAGDPEPAQPHRVDESVVPVTVAPIDGSGESVPAPRRRGSGLPDVLRLWVLAPLRADPGAVSDALIAGLSIAALALWAALNRWQVGAGAEFTSWNIPSLGLYVLAALGFAYVAARVSAPRARLRGMVFAAAALMLLLALLASLLEAYGGHRAANPGRIALWLYVSVYMFVALRRVTGQWQWRAGRVLILLLGGFFAWGEQSFWSADLWYVPEERDAGQMAPKGDSAALLFNQRARIDETVAAMRIEATPAPKVFFVGFAGVGWQKVFAEEIKFAAHVIAERFGSGQRQLLLVNDRRDLDTYAIADTTSLAYGLKAIARRMDLDRDVLVLSLSSHGGAEPVLSVANGMLNLDQLTGASLAEALAASGIKRRIIIISACHAGAFIPVLENPDTIVIAAAAADKTSFGCADDRELTYFGEAFYRDALPHAGTLQGAFEEARRAIAERERRETQTPSDPQASFGTALAPLVTDPGGPLHMATPAARTGR